MFEGLMDMVACRGVGLLCIPPPHVPQNASMFLQSLLWPAGPRKGRRPQPLDGVLQGIERLRQITIVGRTINDRVKLLVQRRVTLRVGFVGTRALGENLLEHVKFAVGRVPCGKGGGRALKHFPHGIKFQDLRVLDEGHDQATLVLDEDFLRFQSMERFANRRSADTEPIGNFNLPNAISRT